VSRELAIAGVALCALISGCATYIEGSEKPPVGWIADPPLNECVALSGNYATSGIPAPANAHAGTYGAVWPAEGSLLSIIERGTNAAPRKSPRLNSKQDPANVVVAMSILVDESGRITFEAKSAKGEKEKLRPQAWTCKSGALTSLVALDTKNFESYVQLWKSGNDLIAEQTIRATEAHSAEAGKHRPVARFHFRFSSTIDSLCGC
jgi:hypothetical protein